MYPSPSAGKTPFQRYCDLRRAESPSVLAVSRSASPRRDVCAAPMPCYSRNQEQIAPALRPHRGTAPGHCGSKSKAKAPPASQVHTPDRARSLSGSANPFNDNELREEPLAPLKLTQGYYHLARSRALAIRIAIRAPCLAINQFTGYRDPALIIPKSLKS